MRGVTLILQLDDTIGCDIWSRHHIVDLPKDLTLQNLIKLPAWDASWRVLKEDVEHKIRGNDAG